jgi:hypothetical protein
MNMLINPAVKFVFLSANPATIPALFASLDIFQSLALVFNVSTRAHHAWNQLKSAHLALHCTNLITFDVTRTVWRTVKVVIIPAVIVKMDF